MEDLAANDNREEYLRANIMIDEDKNVFVTPAGKQDSSMLAVFNESNCLIQRPAYAKNQKRIRSTNFKISLFILNILDLFFLNVIEQI